MNEEVGIKDFGQARSCVAHLDTVSSSFDECIEELNGLLSDINKKWQSTGLDKESFSAELSKQVENLVFVKDRLRIFINLINSYIDQNVQASNKYL